MDCSGKSKDGKGQIRTMEEEKSSAKNTDKQRISGGERPSQTCRATRCCKSCTHIADTSHWIHMEPTISTETGVLVYKHSSPPGSYECASSGLRWVCAGEVTLQYHICDSHLFTAELAMLGYIPLSSLMDIKVLSGELLEVHLPHFACLEGSDSSLSDAVRVLRGAEGGVTLETCELTRFHAKLLKPSFSVTEVVVKSGIPVKTHLEMLIYRTRVTPLILFTYVVPWSASLIKEVKDDLKRENFKKIERPPPDTSLWLDSKFSVRTSCHSEINPRQYTLNYVRPNFFEVYMKEPEDCFDLELISGGQSVWKTTLQRADYGMTVEVLRSIAAIPNLDEGRIGSLTNRERLSLFQEDLIKRTSKGVVRDLVEGLSATLPPVMNSYEVERVLHNIVGVEEKMSFLVDMVQRKGELACGMLLDLHKIKDFYLYEDILLKLLKEDAS